MACPFFMPIEKLVNGAWSFPARLPLGCGWSGHCTAPGHEQESPSQEELQQFCNLGYAEACRRLPRDRAWDSVRFGARLVAAQPGGDRRIQVRYVCERAHLPVEHGALELEFVPDGTQWIAKHPDGRVQRMAECFVASYIERKRDQLPQPVAS